MQKILIIYNSCRIGGVESKLRHRIKALIKAGYDCEIAFYFGGKGLSWFNELKHTVVAEHVENKKESGQFRQYLVNKIINEHYDCVISYDSVIVKYLRQAGYQGSILFEHAFAKNFRNLKAISQYGVDAVIVPTEFHKNRIVKRVKNLPTVYVVPNCVGEEFKYYQNARKEIQEYISSLGNPSLLDRYWNRNKKIIGWIARFVPEKNFKDFVMITYQLYRKYKNIEFWIITNVTPEIIKQELEDLTKGMVSSSFIRSFKVLTSVPNYKMPYVYSTIAETGGCVLATSNIESFGNVYMESMACQCPIVAADASAESETIKNNMNGLLYRPHDIFHALTQVEKILDDYELRKKLVANGLDFIMKIHGEEIMVQKLCEAMNIKPEV